MNKLFVICRSAMSKQLVAVFILLLGLINKTNAASPIEGRWDMTIDVDGKPQPSWLEVRHSGIQTLVGQFVGSGGSARPISKVNFKDGKMSFTIPPQWEPETNDFVFEGTLQGENLTGTMIASNGKKYNW